MYKYCNKGDTYFNWTVINANTKLDRHNQPTSRRFVLARCNCGKEERHYATNLYRGDTRSCFRCRKYTPKEDLTGKRFGKLTVAKLLPGSTHPHQWIVNCDCGTKNHTVLQASLRRGHSTSCGCRLKGSDHANFTGYEEIHGSKWHVIKRNAQKRNLPFEITIQQAWELFLAQGRKCALSGKTLQFHTLAGSSDCTASLDRIDSSKGYTINNIQWVHKVVQLMKWDAQQDEFIHFCKQIYEYTQKEYDDRPTSK